MAKRLKPVDVVLVGMGWTGSILAKELSDAGLNVVGLERGRQQWTVPDFQSPAIHDELRYAIRYGLMQDTGRETLSFRNKDGEEALPMRYLGSFLLGNNLGGAGVHWNGQTFRFSPADFVLRTHLRDRYGKEFVDPELAIQDWGVTYDELEPHYDRFEYLCGIGGVAGNIKGQIQPGGNPFEGPRSRPYPNPPMIEAHAGALFRKAAAEMGYHPFPVASANATQPYTNPEGMTLQPCNYCGFCERFGCEHYAKASPQTTILPVALRSPKVELRTSAHVTRVLVDRKSKRATGVTYVDERGQELEQPAELVILCAFGLHNVRLMLLSGIGQPYEAASGRGVVGRNYAYQTMGAVTVFYDESVNINPFMGAGAQGTVIDDFNGDNFDHAKLGFVGGAYICAYTTGGRPIQHHPVPPGTPRWGLDWKKAVARHYNHTAALQCHGSSMPHPGNFLDLDPTYRDAYGQPLLRMTFDFPKNDLKMADYLVDRAEEIAQGMGGKQVVASRRTAPYSITTYQTTHNSGGAVMGADPKTSAVNRYLQSWDVPNVFVMGACVFPHNPGYNPTDTVGALTYWAADAIKTRYLKTPGPLVQS